MGVRPFRHIVGARGHTWWRVFDKKAGKCRKRACTVGSKDEHISTAENQLAEELEKRKAEMKRQAKAAKSEREMRGAVGHPRHRPWSTCAATVSRWAVRPGNQGERTTKDSTACAFKFSSWADTRRLLSSTAVTQKRRGRGNPMTRSCATAIAQFLISRGMTRRLREVGFGADGSAIPIIDEIGAGVRGTRSRLDGLTHEKRPRARNAAARVHLGRAIRVYRRSSWYSDPRTGRVPLPATGVSPLGRSAKSVVDLPECADRMPFFEVSPGPDKGVVQVGRNGRRNLVELKGLRDQVRIVR